MEDRRILTAGMREEDRDTEPKLRPERLENYIGQENVKENLDQNIYKTIIPRNVRLAEAPSYGKPINLYDSRSTGAESYRLLAEEVISREGE